ncbi:MAG: alkaline phosphatase family protein [Bacteroidales bacterium]|nr:alkaline phosphatase family protein [Bacteroidales bacterium]
MKRLAKKVLLIGWDAADWKVINPLIDAGQMPAMEKLINEGVMGNITTLEPPFSPMLWTSIATGKYADKHGVLGFTEPDPEGMGMRPISSHSRKTKAIWNILMQNNLKSHVLGWWPSNPVEPINGIMLSNHFAHSKGKLRQPWPLMPGSVHPQVLEEFFAELRVHPMELTDQHLLPFVPDAARIDQTRDPRLRIIAKNISEAATLHNAATWILETQEWDFLAIYLDTIDHFCHGFMKYHPPRLHNVPEDDFELYKNVITSAYRYHDMMLESLMKLAGEDTTVIIVSDHGFHSDHLRTTYIPDEPAGPADHHREHGIICMKGPGIKKDELVYGSSLLNITPTILTLFGLPLGKDMDGIPLLQAFDEEITIETIPTWDTVKGNDGMHPVEARKDPIADQKALQQLIDLGYVEDPGPDKKKAAEKAEVESKYNLARVFLSNYRFQEASGILSELYEKEKDQGRFALRLAKCYSETGDYQKAEELLQEFIQTAISSSQDINKLREEYEKDIKENPKEKKKKEKEHLKEIRRQLTLQSNIGQAQLMLFDLRTMKENPKQILADLEKNFPQDKRPITMQRKLASLYYKLRQFDKAEECYKILLKHNPENAISYNGLSLVYLAQKKYVEAANAALDAIGLNYYHPMAHYHLGEALYNLEDYENAVNAYEVCLKIIPTFGSVRNKLIEIYNDILKKPELAQKHKDFFTRKHEVPGDGEESDALPLFAELQSKVIELKDPILVVSGLPRSGTSLMMQMLDKGGVPIYTDNTRGADESNPKGYYEHESVKALRRDKKWLPKATGKAVKVISHLLPQLPAKYNYKVIFMLRELSEVVQSQHKMLVRDGKRKEDTYPVRLEMNFKNQLINANNWLKSNHNAAVLFINHREAIENPLEIAAKVKQFLGIEMDINKMASVVDASLYREKSE